MSACVVAPLMWPSAPQLYSGDCDRRAFVIVARDPAFQARDHIDLVADPAFRFVGRVPQLTCRLIAQQLHVGRDIVAILAALRIVVDAEHVDGMASGFPLAEQPRM